MKDPYFLCALGSSHIVFMLIKPLGWLTKKDNKWTTWNYVFYSTYNPMGVLAFLFIFVLFPTKKVFDSLEKMLENDIICVLKYILNYYVSSFLWVLVIPLKNKK